MLLFHKIYTTKYNDLHKIKINIKIIMAFRIYNYNRPSLPTQSPISFDKNI